MKTTYIEIPASSVPAGYVFGVPRQNQGQSIEIAYAHHESDRSEACDGDDYCRETDFSKPVGHPDRVSYYRLATWTTYGSVRGQGPARLTREEAERDLRADAISCERAQGYSDRAVCRIGWTGRLETPSGDAVWPPHGRSTGAVRAS